MKNETEQIVNVQCSDGKKIKVWCSHTDLVLTDILRPNPKNPNKHPVSQIELLGKVIKEQGWRDRITVSKRSGMIVKGHGRLEAAKLIGCEKCPVDYQEYETEADEIADLLADNKIAELSKIDSEMELAAKQFLTDEDFDLELAGFAISDDSFDYENENENENESGETLKSRFIIEIECIDERHQERTYNLLTEDGHKCRVLKL